MQRPSSFVQPRSSLPVSPSATRSRASSVFPYSLAREPSGYSAQPWLPPPPPLPQQPSRQQQPQHQHQQQRQQHQIRPQQPVPTTRYPHKEIDNPFDHPNDEGYESEERDEGFIAKERQERETPLYARSDWGDNDNPTGTAFESTWSQSSYGGGMTAPLPTSGKTRLGYVPQGERERQVGLESETIFGDDHVALREQEENKEGYNLEYDETGQMTQTAPLTSANGPTDPRYRTLRDSLIASPLPGQTRQRSTFHAQPTPGVWDHHKDESTWNQNQHPHGGEHPYGVNTFSDPHVIQQSQSQSQSSGGGIGSTNIMIPEEHERLGRMSVAPARYSLPPPPRPRSQSPNSNPDSNNTWRNNTVIQKYMAYRLFIIPALCLTGALISTLTLQTAQGGISAMMYVPEGAFEVDAAGGVAQLGLWGWCGSGTTSKCRGYMLGDFATSNNTYSIPGSPKLSTLSYLVISQTIFTWFLALHTLLTAFLHFYILFALSIPFDHFVSLPSIEAQVQAEVDLRVRCERFADLDVDGQGGNGNMGYVWAWWAWWAFRRGPVACVHSFLVFVMGLAAFATAMQFKEEIASATGSNGVTFGTGAFMSLVILLLNIDPLISTGHYLVTFSRTWRRFLDPPYPSATALLLPSSEAPLHHTRGSTGETFYRPRTVHPPPLADTEEPIPGSELDPETRRWLIAYPSDPELVPLLADLRSGKSNDDFLLSDVGLLYLRPEGDEPALLVPPAGIIRQEILEDIHLGTSDDDAHVGVDEMIRRVEEVFWWMTVEEDCLAYVSKCAHCAKDGELGTSLGIEEKSKSKSEAQKQTALPFTGVTDWTDDLGGHYTAGESTMAAEMAVAMRKAEEDAEKDRFNLG
ncbi:hypothetical protein BCR39DRAFT_561202 [Naematelia encephala]|uniref:Integrase zinc-binding domain-containing protein n=1 Tax=Naematelia encephala TaxID=71784 RepID=A0A1Y2ARJ5_9TREE|nr:hypothetical protein BCR39DRAFT_561202 [Naematelia encephala]